MAATSMNKKFKIDTKFFKEIILFVAIIATALSTVDAHFNAPVKMMMVPFTFFVCVTTTKKLYFFYASQEWSLNIKIVWFFIAAYWYKRPMHNRQIDFLSIFHRIEWEKSHPIAL